MREITFLQQNAEKWKRFEAILGARSIPNPQDLTDLFVQITDDLSYARTFYPDSKTTLYLNELAQQVHTRVYRTRKEPRNRLVSFWTDELPAIMASARTEMFVAVFIFTIAVGLGVISTLNDGSFARLILGDQYVNMTLSNIENDDPMAVYKQANEVTMFLGITLNNVRVAFIAFAAGLLLSVGTGLVLFQNGVMVGTFLTMFHSQGQFWIAMRTIWIHGVLEISAILIAGAAGLIIGNSILFPGTYSRAVSFRRGARKGMKVVFGTLPLFVVAGFLEGFVTRRTAMPLWLSLAIIAGSLVFVLFYYILYPSMSARRDARGEPNQLSKSA